jgi:5-methylcytosine-specific restriction endonuclease McrA
MKRHVSPLWNTDKNTLQKIYDESDTLSEIIEKCGYKVTTGGTYRTIKIVSDTYDIDKTKFKENNKKYIKNIRVKRSIKRDYSIEFIENSTAHRRDIKKYILKNNLIDYKCNNCSNIGFHNDEPLILHLEHKNGMNNDNRLENLCFLCPNCHSQTKTYCGRNARKNIKTYETVERKHERIILSRKFNPSRDELKKMVWEMPVTKVSKLYGVSDSAIKKRCKAYNIETPPRGYWTIKKSEK